MRTLASLSRTGKHVVASLLYYSGLLGLLIKRRCRSGPIVLMYHRVLGQEDRARSWSQPHIIVNRETFARHLHELQRHFEMWRLDDFVEYARGRRDQKRPACLITFDDGWRDTYTEAFPLLRRHRVPAVVFLPFNFVGTGRLFWQEQLGRALFRLWERRDGPELVARVAPVLERHGLMPVLRAAPDQVREVISDLVRTCKEDAPSGMEDLTGVLADVLSIPSGADEVDGFVDWMQVREMAAAGISFGAHGLNHLILTRVPADVARAEIAESIAQLEARLEAPVAAFSYPNGDWNPALAGAVSASGVPVAFATGREPFVAPHAFRRINIKEDNTDTAPMLLARIAGVF